MKKELKIIGAEALYLLLSTVVAAVAALIQMTGRTYNGDYSGIIFSGSIYTYNAILYIIGIAIYFGFMIVGYKCFLKTRICDMNKSGVGLKIAFFVVALIFAFMMFAAIVLCGFMVLGMNDSMKPEILFLITGYVWPVINLIFMIVIELRICRRQ